MRENSLKKMELHVKKLIEYFVKNVSSRELSMYMRLEENFKIQILFPNILLNQVRMISIVSLTAAKCLFVGIHLEDGPQFLQLVEIKIFLRHHLALIQVLFVIKIK